MYVIHMAKLFRISFVGFLLITGLALSLQAELPDPPASVLWYAFDGVYGTELRDHMGSAHGVVNGAVELVAGKRGRGLGTSLSNEWVDTPSVNVDDGTWSVSAWFRIEASPLGTNTMKLLQQLDGTGTGGTWLAVKDVSGTLKLTSQIGGAETTGGTVSLNQWHHAAMVSDGGTIRLYLDGVKVAETNQALEINAAGFRIGNFKQSPGDAHQWVGKMDDVAFYDRALTQTEINFLVTDLDSYTSVWVATTGNDISGNGSVGSPYASLGKALEVATPLLVAGTPVRIQIGEGIYREGGYYWAEWTYGGAARTTPLVIEGEHAERTVFSGADVWVDGWTQHSTGVWRHTWSYDWGLGPDPWVGTSGSLPDEMRRREMLIIDGVRMDPVFALADLRHNSYFVDEATNWIYFMGPEPNGKWVEVPVHESLLETRGKENFLFRKVTLRHYNNTPGDMPILKFWGRSESGEPVTTNMVVEDCRFMAAGGQSLSLSVVRGGVVRRCFFDDNGFLGFSMSLTRNSRIEAVESHRANWRGYPQGYLSWSAGGAKITSTEDMTVSGFVAGQNLTNGFWVDIQNRRNRLEDLHAYQNKNYGAYLEFSEGPLVLDGAWLGGNSVAIMFGETTSGEIRNTVAVGNENTLEIRQNDRLPMTSLLVEDNEWANVGQYDYLIQQDGSVDAANWTEMVPGLVFRDNRYSHAETSAGFKIRTSGIPQNLSAWQSYLDSTGVPNGKGDDNALPAALPMDSGTNRPFTWEIWDDLPASTLTALRADAGFQAERPDEERTGWLLENRLGREGAYGMRGTTVLHVAESGVHRFRLSTAGQAELWWSADPDGAGATKVLESSTPTFFRDPNGPVYEVSLTAGDTIWLQVLHVGEGLDSPVSVMFQRPNRAAYEPLSAVYLGALDPVPFSVEGLIGWYDAQTLDGVDGSPVTQWEDRVGVVVNTKADPLMQVTGLSGTARAPTLQTIPLNGYTYKALRFVPGASGEYELLGALGMTPPTDNTRSLVIVYKGGANHIDSRPIGFGSKLVDGRNDKYHWNLATDGDGSLQFDGSYVQLYLLSGLTRNDVLIRVAEMEGFAQYDEHIDVLDADFIEIPVMINGALIGAPSSMSGDLYIGDLHPNGVGGGSGATTFDILEVLVYDRSLLDSERGILQAYLKQKYTSPSGNPQGVVGFISGEMPVLESDGSLSLTVRRSGGSLGAASVQYVTANGTATAGTDYTSVSGTLTWADGDASDRTITVSLVDDAVSESMEAFSLVLSNPSGVSLGGNTIQISVEDDDWTQSAYLLNFGETAYILHETDTWQTFDLNTGTGSGAGTETDPKPVSAVTLKDASGNSSAVVTFSASGGTDGTVALHVNATASQLSGNPYAWYDQVSAAPRETYAVKNGSAVWTFTLAGFASTDVVTVEFVFARGDTGDRAMTVSYQTTGDVLNDAQVDADGGPQYPVISGLTGSTQYAFAIQPTGTGWGCLPNAMRVSVKSAQTLDAPTLLNATTVSATRIDLSWVDNSDNETGFRVQRSGSSGGPWSDVITTAANASTFSDTVLANAVYYYQVVATDDFNESGASNEAMASTLDTDDDGMLDAHEILAGSDPGDGNSRFEMIEVTPASGLVAFEVPTANGSHYRVWCRDSMSSGDWQVLPAYADVVGTGSPFKFEDSPGGTRFYKIEVQATAFSGP